MPYLQQTQIDAIDFGEDFVYNNVVYRRVTVNGDDCVAPDLVAAVRTDEEVSNVVILKPDTKVVMIR